MSLSAPPMRHRRETVKHPFDAIKLAWGGRHPDKDDLEGRRRNGTLGAHIKPMVAAIVAREIPWSTSQAARL
jgi:hypothetical protein